MRARESSAFAPVRAAILVGVDLDRDLLAWLVAGVAQVSGAVEVAEDRVPRLPIGRLAGEALEGIRHHTADDALIGVGVVPPVAGLAVPACGVRRVGPHDPSRVDSLADAHRLIGWLGGDEVRLPD